MLNYSEQIHEWLVLLMESESGDNLLCVAVIKIIFYSEQILPNCVETVISTCYEDNKENITKHYSYLLQLF